MGSTRFDVFYQPFFGIGFFWRTECRYPLELSFTLPFFSVVIGFGKVRW